MKWSVDGVATVFSVSSHCSGCPPTCCGTRSSKEDLRPRERDVVDELPRDGEGSPSKARCGLHKASHGGGTARICLPQKRAAESNLNWSLTICTPEHTSERVLRTNLQRENTPQRNCNIALVRAQMSSHLHRQHVVNKGICTEALSNEFATVPLLISGVTGVSLSFLLAFLLP